MCAYHRSAERSRRSLSYPPQGMALPQEPEGLQPGTQLRVSLCFVEMEQGRFIILPRNLELPTHGITSQYVVMPILSHGLSMSNWY